MPEFNLWELTRHYMDHSIWERTKWYKWNQFNRTHIPEDLELICRQCLALCDHGCGVRREATDNNESWHQWDYGNHQATFRQWEWSLQTLCNSGGDSGVSFPHTSDNLYVLAGTLRCRFCKLENRDTSMWVQIVWDASKFMTRYWMLTCVETFCYSGCFNQIAFAQTASDVWVDGFQAYFAFIWSVLSSHLALFHLKKQSNRSECNIGIRICWKCEEFNIRWASFDVTWPRENL